MTPRRAARGFTLLEVMISLAILAVSLVAISDLNGTAVQMHYYARRSTQATLLIRGKMLDLEELLHKEGFHDFDDEKHGTFEDEGQPEYTWKAEILKPDIQLDESSLLGLLGLGGNSTSNNAAGALPANANGLTQGLQGAAGAIGGLGGAAGGLAALGPMAGLLQGQAKNFIETLKKSVREVRLTVAWRDGANDRTISASEQVVILPESVGAAQQTGPTAGPTTPGQAAPGIVGPPVNLGRPPGTGRSGDGDSQ